MKRCFIIYFIIYIVFSLSAKAATIIQAKEELVYEVSFLNFKLGTIKIVTYLDTLYQSEKVHHSKVFIQSNPNIPFYSIKTIFNSYMDTSLSEGRFFVANSKEQNNEWSIQRITFRNKTAILGSGNLRNEKWYGKKKITDSTYSNIGKVVDGSSLFFFARQNADKTMSVKLPTIMDLDIANTIIKFTGKITETEIVAVDYPIQSYYLEGKGEWKAIYGLGDKFQGWFSADAARIPLKAKMKVYLGNIDIELKSWKRAGWMPPRSK